MSTTAKRAEIRRALIGQGFRRINSTHDRGDGVYAEVWVDQEENGVTFSWAPRTREKPSTGLSEEQIDVLSEMAERYGPTDLHPRSQRR